MQLFSRNKAIAALSLGALVALGACGDDVTVPAPVQPAESVSISPSNANMNVGETLNFAVQITGGSASTTLSSCTSSSATVATAAVNAGACRVTAVAAGNATITATTSTGKSAAAAVAVAAPAPAITGLTVSPTAAQVAVGQSVTLVPTVNRANASVNVAYTYTSSATAVATVDATGRVTAVAPGVASITISATGTGTGAATASLSTAAAITVSDRTPGLTTLQVSPTTASLLTGATQQVTATAQGPRASAATITYGTSAPAIATVNASGLITAVAPGTATITVTAQATQDGAFAASSLTGLITVTVSPAAQVSIARITNVNDAAVDMNAVSGQIFVVTNVVNNGQQVSSVQAFVCPADATTCPAAGQAPAAQQSFAGGAPTGEVRLQLNTADFAVNSDWSAATSTFSNGLKVITVTATTAGASSIRATSNLAQLNFANTDGLAVRHQAPARSAADANGRVTFGGPGADGRGRITIVPVIYTANRTLRTATVSVANCGSSYTFVTGTDALPWTVSYGATRTLDANGAPTALGLGCPYATPANVAANVNALITNPSDANGVAFTAIASSPSIPSPAAIAVDYIAPTITTLQVAGGGSTGVENGWVNGSYRLDERDANGNPLRYIISDNNGVGLRSTRDTRFSICNTPDVVTNLTAPVDCASPVASGGLSSTISSMGLGEHATNLTNQAYFVVASESDRLGNTVTSNPFAYTDNSGSSPVTVAATSTLITFGVDVTAPVLLAIPAPAFTEPADQPSLSGFARTTIDSIFTNGQSTYFSNTLAIPSDAGISAANALFAVRVRDARSGFVACAAGTCPTHASRANIGTFQIERRRSNIPVGTSAPSNSAIVENIIDVPTTLAPTVNANVMDATALSGDASIRQFSINIFGSSGRYPSALPAAFSPVATVSGYYAFTGTVRDRAGNTTTIPTRRVVIDNGTPTVTSVALPSTLTGGTQPTFTINGSDDLEVTGAELSLAYTGMSIRYPRVTGFAATSRTGLFGTPFSAFTTGLLGAVVGTGASSSTFSGNVTMPAPLIQDLQILATSSSAPSTATTGANKPTTVTGTLFDVKSMVNTTGPSTSVLAWTGASASASQTIPGFAVSGSTVIKQWGPDFVNGTTGAVTVGAKVSQWFVYSASATSVEFRSSSSSAASSVPFSSVRVVTRRFVSTSGQYEGEYIDRGVATYAGTVDDGNVRFHRWTWTAGAAVSQGNQTTIAAFADGDSVRAIGLDAQGNGLATAAGTTSTTAFGRIIASIAAGNVNVFASTASSNATPLTQADAYTASALFGRSFASTPVVSATNVSGDSRVFIGTATGANATARVYFPLTLAAGVSATTTNNTTVTCTSSSADVVVVAQGVAQPLSSGNTSSTALQPFCDIRGNTAGGVATLTVTAARAGTGPYSDATAQNTFTTTGQFYVGTSTLTSLGTVGTLTAFSSLGAGKTATFTIAAPTFAGTFSIATATPVYTINNAGSNAATGVSTSVAVNALDGSATVTVSCTAAALAANSGAGTSFAFHIVGRAVSATGYANPIATGTGITSPAVSGTCN